MDTNDKENDNEDVRPFGLVYRCQENLAPEEGQRYKIAPIAITPSGMPGNTPPEPYGAATIQVVTVGRTCLLGSRVALIANGNISKTLVIAYGIRSEQALFSIASAPRGSFL